MNTTKNSTKPMNAEDEADLVEFLKHCVVSKDKVKLKSKLNESIELRRKLMRQNKEGFADFMTFYFESPELVGIYIHFEIIRLK